MGGTNEKDPINHRQIVFQGSSLSRDAILHFVKDLQYIKESFKNEATIIIKSF